VVLFNGAANPPERLDADVTVPAAIKTAFADWRQELLGASMVMIHSKVVVVDPFGAHPVLMTGSHNLGAKASAKNDDNLVIIENNAALAAAYAVNIIAIYQEYRWRHYVAQHAADPKAWRGLADDDQWQTGYLTNDKQEMNFWLNGAAQPASPATPAGKPRRRTAAGK
ncbi:MAG: phospholipase D-like domain-containing protein, partial [Bryobacteraceae bacterium]